MSIDDKIERAFERHESDVRPGPGAWQEVRRRVRRRHRARLAATALGAAVAIAGAIVVVPKIGSEPTDRFDALPDGWQAIRSEQGGYRVGYPSSWKARSSSGVTMMVPPDAFDPEGKPAFTVTVSIAPEPYDRIPANYRDNPAVVRVRGRQSNRYTEISFGGEPDAVAGRGVIYRIAWPRLCPPRVTCDSAYTLIVAITASEEGLWGRYLPTAERIVKTAEPAPVSTPEGRAVRAKIRASAIALAATPDALWALRSSPGGTTPGSLVKIDPQTNRVVEEIPVGTTPAGLAASMDAVWVTHNRCEGRLCNTPTPLPQPSFANSVWRIDPRTNRVVARIAVPDAGDIAIGEGAVWVGGAAPTCCGATIYMIDPATNRVVADVGVGGSSEPRVAIGSGRVWTVAPSGSAGANLVSIVDLHTHRVLETLETPRGINEPELAFGFGSAWVTTVGRDSPTGLVRIDPATMRIAQIVTIPEAGNTGVDLVTTGEGYVWTVSGRGELSRIDPDGNVAVAWANREPFAIGDTPPQSASDIVTAFGSVWVASSDGQIWRLRF